MATDICALCDGEIRLIKKNFKRSKTPTRPQVLVKNVSCLECENCGEIFFDPEQARIYEQKTVEQERKALNLLTSDEIRDIVDRLGAISKNHLEKILGINPRSLYRWLNNISIQSASADAALRLLRLAPNLIEKLASERNISLHPRIGRPRAASS